MGGMVIAIREGDGGTAQLSLFCLSLPLSHLTPCCSVLVREGDSADRVGFIQEGTCAAYAQVPNTTIKSAQVSTQHS